MRIIFLGITASLFCAALTVCLVGYKTNKPLLSAWTRPFICPLLLAASILFLVAYLPDSKNILFLTSAALVCNSAGIILTTVPPEKSEKRAAAGAVTFTLSGAFYLMLLWPSFYLLPLPAGLFSLLAVCYAAAEIFVILRLSKKEKLISLLIAAAYAAVILTLHFAALITAVKSLRLYSVPLFLGATALAFSFFCAARTHSDSGISGQFLPMLLFALAQLFLCAGFCCMIAL